MQQRNGVNGHHRNGTNGAAPRRESPLTGGLVVPPPLPAPPPDNVLPDPLAWLALGVAIGSAPARVRAAAELRDGDLGPAAARSLLKGLRDGRDATVQALAKLGVPVGDRQLAADAVLDAAVAAAGRLRQRAVGWKAAQAARLMGPEDYRKYLAELLAELAPPEVAGETLVG